MNKPGLWVLALSLPLCVGVVAQDSGNAAPSPTTSPARHHNKTIRMSGKVSDDGTRFTDDASRRVWAVKNIEALKGFESQQAFLRGRVDGDTNLIEVLFITAQQSHTAHLSDSAFRR